VSFILGVFGNSREALKLEHGHYRLSLNSPALHEALKKAARIGILGEEEFIDRVRRVYLGGRFESPDREPGELRRLRMRPEIIEIARQIVKGMGSTGRLSKRCAIYVAHRFAGFKLREIGDHFGIGPGAVSESYRRTAKEICSNETLSRVIGTVRSHFSNHGPGTGKQKTGKV
jgi:hypothetical protein